jgi:hypothetical protein
MNFMQIVVSFFEIFLFLFILSQDGLCEPRKIELNRWAKLFWIHNCRTLTSLSSLSQSLLKVLLFFYVRASVL